MGERLDIQAGEFIRPPSHQEPPPSTGEAAMAKLAAQLKDKFFGLVGRITSCGGRAHKDAAAATDAKSVTSQQVQIRSRGGAPREDGGAKGHINDDVI